MIDYTELMMKAERTRKKLGEDNHSPIDIFALAQGIEHLTLVYYPMGDAISGMCVKGSDERCTIALNSSMTLGRQRFTLAHELYHRYHDDDNLTSICSKKINTGSETERKADAYAAYFLMPRVALCEKVEELLKKHEGDLTIQDIIRIEQFFGVSHQAAVYQLNNCGHITRDQVNELLNTNVKHIAVAMGYRSDLYCPLPEEKQFCTFGHYINQAETLLSKGIISNGKHEELLLEAFREDLVYGLVEGDDLID
ncbi:MAG: ImmA/IrrE family metallo-endopeptidase [Spirochaetales bacterium]|nr:ImmA/IrrE family metallo-endopeptidase [Candidatus Physcosoma equi]